MPVRFYKLSTVPILKALPRLVEKIYESRQAIHIYVPDKGLLKTLNDALWTYTPLGFLPHGVAGDSYEDQQPILLSSALTIKNNAEICVCTEAFFLHLKQLFMCMKRQLQIVLMALLKSAKTHFVGSNPKMVHGKKKKADMSVLLQNSIFYFLGFKSC